MCVKCPNTGSCSRKFWLESPSCLLNSFDIIPNDDMTVEERMNAITRLIIIVFIILLVMQNKNALMFLIISLIIIVIMYYSKNKDSRHMVGAGATRYDVKDLEKGLSIHKKNPRRPYPALVPEDLEVKAARINYASKQEMLASDNRIPEQAKRSWIHRQNKHNAKLGIGETIIDNSINDETNTNYIIIRGAPTILEDKQYDIQVIVDSGYHGETNMESNLPRSISPSSDFSINEKKIVKNKFRSINDESEDYYTETENLNEKPTGYDLYLRRQINLEKQLRSKERPDRDSHINSIF